MEKSELEKKIEENLKLMEESSNLDNLVFQQTIKLVGDYHGNGNFWDYLSRLHDIKEKYDVN